MARKSNITILKYILQIVEKERAKISDEVGKWEFEKEG